MIPARGLSRSGATVGGQEAALSARFVRAPVPSWVLGSGRTHPGSGLVLAERRLAPGHTQWNHVNRQVIIDLDVDHPVDEDGCYLIGIVDIDDGTDEDALWIAGLSNDKFRFRETGQDQMLEFGDG